jgi:hypothetical protein
MKQVTILDGQANEVVFNVHKFSPLDGRKIIAGYPLALLGSSHTYASNEEAMRQLLFYCSVTVEGEEEPVHLTDAALVNTHVPDWWTLVQLEFECLKFNCSFLEGQDLYNAAKGVMTELLRNIVAERLEMFKK